MQAADPKGYYAILGLQPGASASMIRAAYLRLAKVHHPDTKGPGASEEQFKLIAAAYETLSNAKLRTQYDNSAPRPTESAGQKVTPVKCSQCQKVAVQPRYLVYWSVTSFIVGTRRTPTQGVFCSACAIRTSLRASIASAFFGWWSFPWGPLWTVPAILGNAFGGERRPDIDDELQWRNAVAFAIEGKFQLAYILARRLRRSRDEDLALRALRLTDVLEKEGVPRSTPSLKDAWSFNPLALVGHLALLLLVPVAILLAVNSASREPTTFAEQGVFETTEAPAQVPLFDAAAIPPPVGQVTFVGSAPRLAPLSIITRSGSDYLIKMVNLGTGQTELSAYVQGGVPFETLMPLGTYELRYAAGRTWYGEEHLFGPETIYSRADANFYFNDEGYQYSGYTVELVMQAGGNLEVDRLAPSEF